jgi:serine/threonine-protein kinase
MSSSTTIPDTSRIDPGVKLVGRTVGKYRIVRLIGRGGMGRVYEALNTTIHKRVAMKLIDHDLAKNEEANARFQREALAASAVESPYIVQIFDAGQTDDGVPFIVMELLPGADLGRRLKEQGRLPLDQALLMGAQVLKGLHHAHAAGIVHRDLKPDNVYLVERDDEPVAIKLLDFGVSKIARATDSPLKTLTRQGTVVGTPYYMSPEQAQAFPDVDGRTDLYSLGAILYECLAGRPPVEGQSYEQVIVNICVKDIPDVRTFNPDVPASIAALIHKALGREREARFANAREMFDALAESAPEGLKNSIPSAMRISAKPSTPAVQGIDRAQAITTPLGLSGELADTVNLAALPRVDADRPEELQQSGISTRAARTGAVTDDITPPKTERRWALAVVPAIALVIVGAFYLGDRDAPTTTPTAEPVKTEAPEPEAGNTVKPPEPKPSQPEQPGTTPTPSEPPAKPGPAPKPKGNSVRPPGPRPAPKETPSAAPKEPPPPEPGLELLPR